MPQHLYEVEIKCLLVEKKRADELVSALFQNDPNTKEIGRSSQLNHYFLRGDFEQLKKRIQPLLSDDEFSKMVSLIVNGCEHAVRTRKANEKVLLVIKAVADDTNSWNGTARIEFETSFQNKSIEEIDQILLDSGFSYQAKWSRDRVEYQYKDYTVSIDKNAGYGYLAEVEKVVDNKDKLEQIKEEIRQELGVLGISELPQDRLDRMFQFYNQHWQEYYGTDKIFIVKRAFLSDKSGEGLVQE